MNPVLQKNHRVFFYSLWFLVGLIQASITELLDDEAYYWVFSRFLDWGYFDHPPMTALLIKIGYSIFHNELGVRLLMVVLSTATVWIAEKLLREKQPFVFYTVCFSLAVLQIGGLLAVPDVPLMFFTALFFLQYQKFTKATSFSNTILLGVITALMMYSKYHAVLIVFFTLISNIALFRKWQTYIAGLVALFLFIPHLWWQYQHDWISFRYHLFESNVNPYKISYTTEYILGQLLIAGPLAGFIFWYALFRYHTTSSMERALKFTGIGIFIFFLASSFRGRVEANWTAPAIIPLLVISHQYLLKHVGLRKWVYRLMIATVILVLFVRIIMVVDIVPAQAVAERFHQYKEWPRELRNRTKGLPVVFSSSYQKASKYWFYSGQTSFSLNEYKSRRSNYNFWPIEENIFDKPVYIIDADTTYAQTDSLETTIGNLHYSFDSSFHSFTKVMFTPTKKEYVLNLNTPLVLTASIDIPSQYKTYLQTSGADYKFKLGVYNKQKWIEDINLDLTLQTAIKQKTMSIEISPKLENGTYFLRFAVESDAGWFTHNSDKIKLEVK